jgi:toxin FitB
VIVLDTNVLSELTKAKPDPSVVAWLNAQPIGDVWTTAVTVFEVQLGLAILPSGKRKDELTEAFTLVLQRDLNGRVLELDTGAAEIAASVAAQARAGGRPIEIRDVLIAGTVAYRQATLATRNVKHFQDTGIRLVNPWLAPLP